MLKGNFVFMCNNGSQNCERNKMDNCESINKSKIKLIDKTQLVFLVHRREKEKK